MVASEDAIGEKWDRCITDTIVKMGAGLGLGAVASFILFRRRAWPAIFGTGAGFGMGYNNCHHDFKAPVVLRAFQIKEKAEKK
ncbi:MICOS complex subunit Mic10-like [Varroa jacobsoni]|uniref:MICOS complex subunit MIC10 n=1 Tax=Varroa destructor TaxID=109461 RepID=A0A7M7KNF7_VARDE|nr:MICOS complex subunit Mic10-like [Varroa destructor]XP_022669530.1 MICOS complex subunit Mic10-like [Varroa destructor]XP_022687172.1 MICOS complex subunit Mic10-like [Varroa jacobsoni]XP_022687173.1 MICOS complex subunit Mic10-like [Varroa jacobsoni]